MLSSARRVPFALLFPGGYRLIHQAVDCCSLWLGAGVANQTHVGPERSRTKESSPATGLSSALRERVDVGD